MKNTTQQNGQHTAQTKNLDHYGKRVKIGLSIIGGLILLLSYVMR